MVQLGWELERAEPDAPPSPPPPVRGHPPAPARPAVAIEGESPLPPDGLDLDRWLADAERAMILAALERTGGVRARAAELLRINQRSLRYRMQKLLDPADS